MKKSIFSKVGAAAMVLTLVTASLVGGTFAKYTSTASSTATATAAAWNITFKGNDSAFSNETSITLSNNDAGRKENKIVPGDSGTLKFEVLGNDSEVGFDYTIKITGTSPVVFTKDGKALTDNKIEGHVNYADLSKPAEETITWELPESTEASGVAGQEYTFNVEITATQSTEVATAPSL